MAADGRRDREAETHSGCAMSVLSLLFWGLVLVTALISVRWGAMIGLIAFVFALLFGAVAVSRWAPPRQGLSGDRHAVSDMSVTETRISELNSKTSRR